MFKRGGAAIKVISKRIRIREFGRMLRTRKIMGKTICGLLGIWLQNMCSIEDKRVSRCCNGVLAMTQQIRRKGIQKEARTKKR